MVEPVDPFERGELDLVDTSSRPVPTNHLRFVEAVDCLGQSVVVGVADAADRGRDAQLVQPICVTDRQVLDTAVAVMHEAAEVRACVKRLLQRIQGQVTPK